MRVVTFLAQFAVVQTSNLLTIVNAPIDSLVVATPHSLVALFYVEWMETNISHIVKFELIDAEGTPVATGPGLPPLSVEIPVEIGRPAGVPRGMTFKIPLALSFSGLQLPPGMYEWNIHVDEMTNKDWNTSFLLLPPAQA